MRPRDGSAGQSLVETALVLPLLLVLMIGVVEGSRLLLAAVGLTTGVMAGAQYGALYPENATDTAGIEAAVRGELALAGGTPTNPTVTSSSANDGDGEKYVSVAATFNWSPLMRYPGLPTAVTITRSAVMQVHR